MSKLHLFWLSLIFLLFQCQIKETKNLHGIETVMIQDWSFKNSESPDSSYIEASVPGSVIPELFQHGIIEDPFKDDNESDLQWIGKSNWDYRAEFTVDPNLFKNQNMKLVFEGLDTYAEVYLNEELLFHANNMFVKYSFDVKDLLTRGKNALLVRFKSPVISDSIRQSHHPFLYPDTRSFTRKAPYQYGWDWGPRLISMGIWKPVYLQCYNDFLIEELSVVTDSIIHGKALTRLQLKIDVKDTVNLHLSAKIDNDTNIDEEYKLQPGNSNIVIPIEFTHPKLWWPNNMGDPHLYKLQLSLSSKSTSIDTSVQFGVRKIDLVQKKDSIGASFYFEVNGKPLYIFGSNYIPENSFPSQVTQHQSKKLLRDAAAVGMNMIRVWGGGIYPGNDFYDICDSLGLMVWQDFMFACNFYPGDPQFLQNVKREVQQQVSRIKGRTCLALWCGNNEIDEAWHNWGYQESLDYSQTDQLNIWSDYLTLFDTLIPGILDQYNSDTKYISSSPKIGWGNKESLYEGDMHYWGVWWGAEPFEMYRAKTGRFMSEYGFQSFPAIELMDQYLSDSTLSFTSPALLNHQKHPRGMELIHEYMSRDFKVPQNPEDYIYVSQLVQERGMTIAIESHRMAKPKCMGTLYWQFNDCWPVISWSGIDYGGNWKAFHYALKRLYNNQILIVEELDDQLEVFLANEDPNLKNCRLQLNTIDFEGHISLDSSIQVIADINATTKVFSLDKKLFSEMNERSFVCQLKLMKEDSLLSETLFYLVSPKELQLKNATIDISILHHEESSTIFLESDQLVKNLYLRDSNKGHFSNNYFDVLPGQVYKILYNSKINDPVLFTDQLVLNSLNPVLKVKYKKKGRSFGPAF